MKRTQSGFATLLVTMLLLLLATTTVLSSSRVVFFEQKTASNTYKQTQALAAGMAGIEKSVAYLSAPTGNPNKDTFFDRTTRLLKPAAFPLVETLAGNSGFRVTMTQPDAVNDPFQLRITSVGCSDGCTGASQVTLTQLVRFRQLMPHLPDDALIARGNVSLRGSTSAENGTGKGYAVLAGGSIDAKNTSGSVAGNNALLAGYPADDYFYWFFGDTKANVKDMVTNLAATFPPPDTGGIFWIEGDVSQHANATYGTPTDPVVLIVNGNLSINGNVTVYGVVYVVGGPSGWQNSGGGSAHIVGAAVSEAGASSTGNLDIAKNQSVLNSVTATTRLSKLPGSWKDF